MSFLKKTVAKADEAIDQAKKDMSNTADKIQKALDESGKSVTVIINAVLITLGVSITANIVNIILDICRHRRSVNPSIIIQHLHLK